MTDAASPAPAPAPASEPLAPAPLPPAPAARRSRGLGATAFVLSLLAFLGDIVAGIVFLVAVASAIGSFGSAVGSGSTTGIPDLSGAAGAGIVGLALPILGTLLALLGVILGIAAAATRRGRGLGVAGIIIGALVLVGRIVLIILVASAANSVSSSDLNGLLGGSY